MTRPEYKGTTPEEMARWIVSEWRSVRGSDRMLVIAITEALKVIPAVVGDLERDRKERERVLSNLVRSIRTDGGIADEDWPELEAAEAALKR